MSGSVGEGVQRGRWGHLTPPGLVIPPTTTSVEGLVNGVGGQLRQGSSQLLGGRQMAEREG